MCRFIESIKVKDRSFQNVEWNNKRFNDTRKAFYGEDSHIDISDLISIPDFVDNEIYKCRILYGKSIGTVTFEKYIPKNVNTLKLVSFSLAQSLISEKNTNKKGSDYIYDNYSYKYQNRQLLNFLSEYRDGADDILIVRDGFITDTSFSNVVLLKDGTWYTPDTYLLNGTCRQRLLHEKKIKEASVNIENIDDYDEIRLINAMIDIKQARTVKILK